MWKCQTDSVWHTGCHGQPNQEGLHPIPLCSTGADAGFSAPCIHTTPSPQPRPSCWCCTVFVLWPLGLHRMGHDATHQVAIPPTHHSEPLLLHCTGKNQRQLPLAEPHLQLARTHLLVAPLEQWLKTAGRTATRCTEWRPVPCGSSCQWMQHPDYTATMPTGRWGEGAEVSVPCMAQPNPSCGKAEQCEAQASLIRLPVPASGPNMINWQPRYCLQTLFYQPQGNLLA